MNDYEKQLSTDRERRIKFDNQLEQARGVFFDELLENENRKKRLINFFVDQADYSKEAIEALRGEYGKEFEEDWFMKMARIVEVVRQAATAYSTIETDAKEDAFRVREYAAQVAFGNCLE